MAEVQNVAPAKLSRVGKRPLLVPKGVSVNLSVGKMEVQGPKGKLAQAVPAEVLIKKDGETIHVTSSAGGRDAARLQGLVRALLASMINGAASGYERILELVGTGYRCELKGKTVHFSLGFSHPKTIDLPAGVTATIPPDSKGTVLVLASADKAVLGQTAATIRSFRPPEPYGGKGVRYRGEQIRKKAGKAGKAGKK